jgi:C-terminal processing protease CtpA/Prc
MEDWDIAVYQVGLPPGRVGVGFETAFNPDKIVVLKIMPKTFASDKTTMSVGDQLLAIDDVSTEGMTFENAMKLLMDLQMKDGCTLTLSTVAEQSRVSRLHALARLGAHEGEGGRERVAGGCDGIELSRV